MSDHSEEYFGYAPPTISRPDEESDEEQMHFGYAPPMVERPDSDDEKASEAPASAVSASSEEEEAVMAESILKRVKMFEKIEEQATAKQLAPKKHKTARRRSVADRAAQPLPFIPDADQAARMFNQEKVQPEKVIDWSNFAAIAAEHGFQPIQEPQPAPEPERIIVQEIIHIEAPQEPPKLYLERDHPWMHVTHPVRDHLVWRMNNWRATLGHAPVQVTPKETLFARIVFFLFAIAILALELTEEAPDDRSIVIRLAELSIWHMIACVIYFGSLIALFCCRQCEWLMTLAQIIQPIITVWSMVIFIMFYSIVIIHHPDFNAYNPVSPTMSQYVIIVSRTFVLPILVILEFMFSRMPFRWTYFWYMISFSFAYLMVNMAVGLFSDYQIYNNIDWNDDKIYRLAGIIAAYCFIVVVFGLLHALIKNHQLLASDRTKTVGPALPFLKKSKDQRLNDALSEMEQRQSIEMATAIVDLEAGLPVETEQVEAVEQAENAEETPEVEDLEAGLAVPKKPSFAEQASLKIDETKTDQEKPKTGLFSCFGGKKSKKVEETSNADKSEKPNSILGSEDKTTGESADPLEEEENFGYAPPQINRPDEESDEEDMHFGYAPPMIDRPDSDDEEIDVSNLNPYEYRMSDMGSP